MKINSEIKMILGIVIACILLLVAFVWFAPSGGGVVKDISLLVRSNSHMTGTTTAKVTLVEFADFQCPACATVAPYVKSIIEEYKNNPDFNFVYRNFPLPQHTNAIVSAEAAESAGAQGKYWEMVETLYKNQDEWSTADQPIELFVGYAKSLGLDTVKFRNDITSQKFVDFIKADLADANALGVNRTPSLFLNGVEVTNLETLKAQIDKALAE